MARLDGRGILGCVAVQGRGTAHRGDPYRCRLRLGRTPPRSLLRRRAVLPARLCGESRGELDPGARGCRGEADAGATVADVGCGRGASTILLAQATRTRRSSALTLTRRRSMPPGRQPRGGCCRPSAVRGRVGAGLSRALITRWSASSTPCMTWATRSARPGISAPRSPTTARGCWSSRWPATPFGEHQPGRPTVLLGFHSRVHAIGPLTVRRLGPWRPSD